jgi:WD40 repeat protein
MKTILILSLLSLLYGSLLSSTQPTYGLAGDSGYIKYFRLSDGVCLGDFHPDANINSVKISPDGEYTLFCCNGQVKYCHLPEGTLVTSCKGHNGSINSVDISKDGLYALSGGNDLTMRYWRISNGECLRIMTHTNWYFKSVSFSPDGEYAFTTCGTVCEYWRLSDGVLLNTFPGHTALVNSVDVSPDGLYGLSGSNDATLKYWRLSDGQCIRTFTGHSSQVYSVVFTPDGNYALSGSADNTLKLWNVSTGDCIRTFTGHINSVKSVDISIDGGYALSGAGDSTVKYWRISDGTCLRTITLSPNYINSVTFSPLEETGFKKTQSSFKQLPQGIVSASPNPFSNRLRVSLPTTGAVYTLTGRLIMKLDKGDHDIDTSSWKEGVYILKAGEEAKKIVKMENIFLLFLL